MSAEIETGGRERAKHLGFGRLARTVELLGFGKYVPLILTTITLHLSVKNLFPRLIYIYIYILMVSSSYEACQSSAASPTQC